MAVLVECVPNISEGRDKKIIDSVVSAIGVVKGVSILDVDPGSDTNRTVITIVGSPEAVKEGAFQCIKKASELIDMRKQKGTHPRMGATDVCPFVPVSECTMEDCVKISKEVAERVGRELEIPIYLYEESAQIPERKNLANIRNGEYEALETKISSGNFKPDHGPEKFNAKAGATAIGAREFLIAYNVNINTKNKKIANKIALDMREKGRAVRDKNNKFIKENGKKVFAPVETTLKNVKAIGWVIDTDRYGQLAQISINLTNYKITPFYKVLETARELALKYGAVVTGSELVGLIPKQALLESGMYYLKKLGVSRGISEKEILKCAVSSMGLEDIAEFDLNTKVIEYCVSSDDLLASMNLKEFNNELASESPAPGGGSVAALAGSLSASLSAMVGNLTYDKKAYKNVKEIMEETAIKAQKLKEEFILSIDKDTDAFNEVMAAMKLPKDTEENKNKRQIAIENANKKATLIPFNVLKMCVDAADCALKTSNNGNKNSITDAGVAGLMIKAAAYGACYNVVINLSGIEDKKFCDDIYKKSVEIVKNVNKITDEIQKVVSTEIKLEV